MPFQPGNKLGRGRPPAGRSLSEALRVVLSRRSGTGTELMAIAEVLVEKAKAGDIQAIREVFDRTEGRVPIMSTELYAKRPIVIQMTEADVATM